MNSQAKPAVELKNVGTHWTVVARLAWRYLWRNYRRTLIMLAAISIGVWAMIFMTALTRGMVDDMIESSVKTFLGHVQIHHPSYRDDPSVNNSMPAPSDALQDYLDASTLNWGSRVRVPAVVSSERESIGVLLMGVEPEKEKMLSKVYSQISSGRFLESTEDRGIVIGAKLARRLDTELGKRIVVMSQDPDNNIADRGFRIVGIYSAEIAAQEEQYVFVGLATAQAMLNINNQISELEIQGSDYRYVDELLAQVSILEPDQEVLPWTSVDPYMESLLNVMDSAIYIYIVVIFLVLSFGLVNTLVMAVFERVREIGLMLALGMRPNAILRQILLETFYLLVLGLLLGNLLVLITVWPIRDGIDVSIVAEGMAMMGGGSTIYPAVYSQDVFVANSVVIVLGLIAAIFPAFRASRYDPVRALNKS
ncbi:ABC transporter permease [Aurantivibrio plasticivorans]